MGGEKLKIGEIYGKWERLEELSNPSLVMGVALLKGDLVALVIIKEYENSPLRQKREKIQEVVYCMGDASGI